jgi:tetratricopeptide (TPR) repeat protein
MGSMAIDADETARAEEHTLRGLELLEGTTGTKHPLGAVLSANLGVVRSEQGEHHEALRLHREALEVRRELLGPRHPETATSLLQLGAALVEAGKPKEAIEPLEEAVSILAEGGEPPENQSQAEGLHHARFWLARAWWDAGEDRSRARATAQAARDALAGMGGDRREDLEEIDGWLSERGGTKRRR